MEEAQVGHKPDAATPGATAGQAASGARRTAVRLGFAVTDAASDARTVAEVSYAAPDLLTFGLKQFQ